jgi:hypothetical protein
VVKGNAVKGGAVAFVHRIIGEMNGNASAHLLSPRQNQELLFLFAVPLRNLRYAATIVHFDLPGTFDCRAVW